MEFHYQRSYRGSVKAVIFDWAGTTVDYGCIAPAGTFINLFADNGVTITMEQARAPMGLHKRDHIRAITEMASVAADWESVHGAKPTETDVESMFEAFVPALIASIENHTDVIPGADDAATHLRQQGIAIGSTTGYSMKIMERVREAATSQGYTPDVVVCADEVPQARPAPWMALKACMDLGVYPPEAVVKVGDTPADIAEGLNAGMWTIGVVEHGNEVGLSREALLDLDDETRAQRIARARQRLAESGAHFVADSIADVPRIVEFINSETAQGIKP